MMWRKLKLSERTHANITTASSSPFLLVVDDEQSARESTVEKEQVQCVDIAHGESESSPTGLSVDKAHWRNIIWEKKMKQLSSVYSTRWCFVVNRECGASGEIRDAREWLKESARGCARLWKKTEAAKCKLSDHAFMLSDSLLVLLYVDERRRELRSWNWNQTSL